MGAIIWKMGYYVLDGWWFPVDCMPHGVHRPAWGWDSQNVHPYRNGPLVGSSFGERYSQFSIQWSKVSIFRWTANNGTGYYIKGYFLWTVDIFVQLWFFWLFMMERRKNYKESDIFLKKDFSEYCIFQLSRFKCLYLRKFYRQKDGFNLISSEVSSRNIDLVVIPFRQQRPLLYRLTHPQYYVKPYYVCVCL